MGGLEMAAAGGCTCAAVRKVALREPRPVWRKAEGGLAVRRARRSCLPLRRRYGLVEACSHTGFRWV